MSYVLWQGTPISMSKGTISLWFRIPKETVDEFATGEEGSSGAGGVLDPFTGAIPILVFSRQPTGPWTEFEFPVINTFYRATSPNPPFDFQPFPYYGAKPRAAWEVPYNPCMIAVYPGAPMTLGVVLQTRDIGTPQNTNQALVRADGQVFNGMLFGPTKLYWEAASDADARMEWFERNEGGGIEVAVDVWHHLLLSWDLRGMNQAEGNPINPDVPPPSEVKPLSDYFTAKSVMYCAFDDENLTQDKLPTGRWVDGFGDNEIACYSCFRLAGSTYLMTPPNQNLSAPYMGFPQYTVEFATGIQMDTVALPSEPQYNVWVGYPESDDTEEVKDMIQKIEVAELQIFSDFLLDTSDESNRRAFIDTIENGSDEEQKGPVDPKDTEEILGRRPDILLHTSKNWKNGKNTGTTGRAEDGSIIEGGQFETFGEIKKWMPDPRLGES